MKTYSGSFIHKLEPNQILVFASNSEGKHDKGNALLAYKHFGAMYGLAKGPQGQSYALCIKDSTKSMSLPIAKEDIVKQIAILYDYADCFTKEKEFLIAITCTSNLNLYTPQEMADMFAGVSRIPDNIVFNEDFAKLINTHPASNPESY